MTERTAAQLKEQRPMQEQATGIGRRRVLTYLVAAPVLTIAAKVGLDLAAPATADAAIPSLDTTDIFDIGDAVVLGTAPTMPLVVLEVGEDGQVRFEMPRIEMGQGLATACAMMVAEELDVPLSRVTVTLSDARPELAMNMITGGSAGVRSFQPVLPVLAATARLRLVLAAAQRWNLPAGQLSTRDGQVLAEDGRTASYGSLSAAAALLSAPAGMVSTKPAAERTVVGRPAGRLDALDIVTGRKKFAMDLDVPGAMPTMVRRPPTIRGTVRSVNNAAEVGRMPGVIGVVAIPGGGSFAENPPGVAVMAETFGQARDAVNALDVTWGPGTIDGESNDTILARLRQSALPLAVPPLGAATVEAEFDFAPAAHCPLETECAIADVRPDSAEIWAPLQGPIIAQEAIALDLGLPLNKVTVHVVPGGGAFGRRFFWDGVQQAVQVSKALGRPAKVMYHRTDDMRHTRVRPPQYHKVRATILLGQVVSYEQSIAIVSTDFRHGFGEILTATAASSPPVTQVAIGDQAFEVVVFKTMVTSPYNFGVTSKQLLPVPIAMNTASYRSVHIQPARGVEEIIADEIAAKLGKDPVAFRLEFLRQERARAVLRKVAEVGGWGRSMPAGIAQGVGAHSEARSFTACLAEVDCRDPKAPKVTKAVIAIDVGQPINPLGIEAQLQGGLAESISLVFTAGLHVKDGLPLEGSYSQYHFARLKNYPRDVQIIHMPSTNESIGGLGEVGMAATTGALANAYARATGVKPRSFPINFPVDFTPIPPGMLPPPAFP